MNASENVIDFRLLLKNYDIREATQYLACKDILLASEIVRVRELKSKPKIISYLSEKLQKSDRIQKTLSALNNFSANTFADFQQNLIRFQNLQAKTVTKPINKEKSVTSEKTVYSSQRGELATSSSNSSSSNEDLSLSSSQDESTEPLPTASQDEEGYFTGSSQATLLMPPTNDSGIIRTATSIKKKDKQKPNKLRVSQKSSPVYIFTGPHNFIGGSVMPDQMHSHLPPYSIAKEGNPQPAAVNSTRSRTRIKYHQMPRFKELLVEYRDELMDCMDVTTLLKYLFNEKLVTYEEHEILVNEKLPRERNRYLLSILPSKGDEALDRFIKCLKAAKEHLAHSDLAKMLEDRMLPSSDV